MQAKNVADAFLDLPLALKANAALHFNQGGLGQDVEKIALAGGGAIQPVRAIEDDIQLARLAAQSETGQTVVLLHLGAGTAFLAADDDKVMGARKTFGFGPPDFKWIHRLSGV